MPCVLLASKPFVFALCNPWELLPAQRVENVQFSSCQCVNILLPLTHEPRNNPANRNRFPNPAKRCLCSLHRLHFGILESLTKQTRRKHMNTQFIAMQRVYGSTTYLIYWNQKLITAVDGRTKANQLCHKLNQLNHITAENIEFHLYQLLTENA